MGGPSNVNKILELGGNYNFGPVTAYAGYQSGRDLTAGPRSQTQVGTLTLPNLTGGPATRLSSYTLGAFVPVGLAQLTTQYTRAKFESATGADIKAGRIGAGVNYFLSKRTSVYSYVTFITGDLKDYVNEKQQYQLGLRHSF